MTNLVLRKENTKPAAISVTTVILLSTKSIENCYCKLCRILVLTVNSFRCFFSSNFSLINRKQFFENFTKKKRTIEMYFESVIKIIVFSHIMVLYDNCFH